MAAARFHQKKFMCKPTRSAAQFAADVRLFVTRAGAMPPANKSTVPAACTMRGEMPAGRKCADECPEAAVNSKLE
jgi:hypothetical protein